MRAELVAMLRCPSTGSALDLDVLGVDDDGAIRYGLLSAEGGRFAILEGIPLLLAGQDEIVELTADRRFREATALAMLGDRGRRRILPFLDAASDLRFVGRLARAVERRVRARQLSADVTAVFGEPPGDRVTADPLDLIFLGHRHPSAEGYNYFRYRFGTPRYLVALSLIDALPIPQGPVVDVGCGAGHLTWALSQRVSDSPVIGIDPSFAQLVAASEIAPDAEFVCADGRALPVCDGAFALVFSSDVLPYVTTKIGVVREMTRVLDRSGHMLVTALRNATQTHVHGGEPLTVAGWEALFDLPHKWIVGDDDVLDAYLDGRAPGGLTDSGAAHSQTLSLVAAHVALDIDTSRRTSWPHALGPLAPHPLLRPVAHDAGRTKFEKVYPSPTYRADNLRIDEYLSDECWIPDEALEARGPIGPELEQLVRSVALIGSPFAHDSTPHR